MTAVPEHTARPNGWYGMIVLIAAEGALFCALIATYAYLRFSNPAWPPPGVADPSTAAPVALALVLVATTAPMTFAVRAVNRGRRGPALAAVALAFVVQAAYLAIQVHNYADGLAQLPASSSAYASIYYTLLAAHHAHVGVGLLLDLWLLGRIAGGLTSYRVHAVAAIALYWYFVAVAGLVVTATTLSPAW
jgi:cytochrome c oxidase subunit 3